MDKTLSDGRTITVTGSASGRDLDAVQVDTSIGERSILRMLPQAQTVAGKVCVAAAGRLALTAEDVLALRAEAAEDAKGVRAEMALPVNADRRRVSALYARAASLRDGPGEYFPALADAEDALAAWRTAYPEAAAAEDRDEVLAKAQRLEDLAKGALTYDADGSLSREIRQARHDEMMEQARALREQADEGGAR